MARDCETLSPNAQKIFDTLEPFFPKDPFGEVQWKKEGMVCNNGWYDLRKHADRKRLEDWLEHLLGYSVRITAGTYKKEHGSLNGFTGEHFSKTIKNDLDLLLLLEDLDFQIETMDIVEG